MQYLVTMFISSVFDWKYPFWAILVQKLKTVCSKWNLTGRLIRVCRIQCSFYLFILSVLGQKYSFCENSLLLLLSWSMVLILFEYEELNRDAYFFCFRQEVSFLGNFFQKVKIICLTWNLESREIGICRIWWWFSCNFHVIFIFVPKKLFDILVILDKSPSSFLAETFLITSTFSYCF